MSIEAILLTDLFFYLSIHFDNIRAIAHDLDRAAASIVFDGLCGRFADCPDFITLIVESANVLGPNCRQRFDAGHLQNVIIVVGMKGANHGYLVILCI